MDDQRFDALAKRVGTSRRSLLKKMVGIGGAAAVARLGASEAEAARRGYSGPTGAPETHPCEYENHHCTPDGCCVCCNSDTYYEFFKQCYSNKDVCTRPYATCCQYCAAWMGGMCWIP